MYAIKFSKLAFIAVFTVFLIQGCKPAQTAQNNAAPAAEIVKTDAPYSNKEPEKYETEVWQTTAAGVDKFFIARDGEKWRTDSALGTPDQTTSIHTDKEYVFASATKVYSEIPTAHGYDEREETVNAMTRGLLNSKEKAAYEKVGAEGELTKYKVVVDPAKNVETLVFVDEKLGIPVRKEVYKTDGGNRVLDYKVELTGFKTTVDASQFQPLKGYKLVPLEDMKKALAGAK